MQDVRTGHDKVGQRRRGGLRLDGLLVVFLVVGWVLIFASATMALRRSPQRWLRVKLVPQVSADYSVDAAEVSRLAPVRPQIVEAVKRDALVAHAPEPSEVLDEAAPEDPPLLVFGPTATLVVTPTSTLTSTLGVAELTVDAGGPYSGEEGSPVSLAAEGASLRPGTISYRWDLDDDGEYDDAVGNATTTVYYDEGEYAVGVEAADGWGRVMTATSRVVVSNVAPTIYGTGDKRAGEGERISFSAIVYDPGHDVLFYSWDFGDGTGEAGRLEPEHVYEDDGNYVVRFRAEDNDGGVTDAYFIAHVANLPPEVDAGPDQEVDEGGTARFSGRARDEGSRDTLSYAWDLDYDGENFRADVVGATATQVYADGPAEVVAALRVSDKDGGEAIDTVQVRVNNVAPTIEGVSHDGPVGEGTALTLEVTASDVGSDTLRYAFDWENDGEYEEAGPESRVTHVWYDEGEYTVGVRAEDEDGGQASSTTVVVAYNEAPTAVASVVTPEREGTPVTFDGSGTSDPGINDGLTYAWEFGDGSEVVTGTIVTHVYGDNGAYEATLRVTDDSGALGSDGVTVSIVNANPVADAGSDRRVDEGEMLSLSGMASDPGQGDALQVAWDLDYDGVSFDEDVVGSSSVEWRYGDGPARYVVAYRVRDDDYPYADVGGGEIGEAIDTLEVEVVNRPPMAEAGGPYAVREGERIELTGEGRDVAADVLAYEWDLDGDGTYELSGSRVSGVWTQPGEYTVSLRVRDDDGGVGVDTAQVRVGGNTPPEADAGGPYSGDEGSLIELSGSGIDPSNDPLTYTWDLDNDRVFETEGQVVTNRWADDGVYTVTLRVDDGRGGVDTDDAIVTVNNVPPIADAGGPYIATTGITLTLVATSTDVPSDTLTYAWDLDDDGSFDDGVGQMVTHVWTTTGVYTVTLQVDDGDGGVVTDATTVHVNTLFPVAWLGASYFLVRSKRSVPWKRKKTTNTTPGTHTSGGIRMT